MTRVLAFTGGWVPFALLALASGGCLFTCAAIAFRETRRAVRRRLAARPGPEGDHRQ